MLHLVSWSALMWGMQGRGIFPLGKRKISPETEIRFAMRWVVGHVAWIDINLLMI